MTPCSRLYAFLGQEIVRSMEHDISDHPYKQWIETYSSENSEIIFTAQALAFCSNLHASVLGTCIFCMIIKENKLTARFD